MNKYLEDLNLNQRVSSFNIKELDLSTKTRQESFNKERDEYGFDERETWNLDYTSCEWLYCHLKMFLEKASKIVDLNYHTFKIPVLKELKENELVYYKGFHNPVNYYTEEIQEKTQKEAIDLMIEYLEYYLINNDNYEYDFENKAYEKARCAFKIYSIVLPSMWW